MTTLTASRWVRVNRSNRCLICDKPDWCLISQDGEAAICARIESDRPAGNKGAGWLHRLDTARPLPPVKPRPEARQAPRAAPDVLDTTYQALLSELRLSETHRENLRRRGLTDSEIHTLGYKTWTTNRRHELANRLQNRGVNLAGVPGFYLEAGRWALAGQAGILIPVRHFQGFVGLQVRCDETETGRYKWVSSRGFSAGCSPGVPVHVAGPVSIGDKVWITEGPLKADIASLKLGRVVLAVAGVGNWAGVVPIIGELRPELVIVAFDADKASNPTVKLHSEALIACLLRSGIRTFEAEWDKEFKGLDDLLTSEG